MMTKRRAP